LRQIFTKPLYDELSKFERPIKELSMNKESNKGNFAMKEGF
jgi:hypothetical protein